MNEENENTKGLPRRGDEDRHESTDAPVFLVQRRRFQPIEMSSMEWDSDDERLLDSDGFEITEQQAVECELAVWRWDTQSVWFTRAEAQRWADAKSYRGPWRVYSVPAKGELRALLRAQTDYERDVESK